MATSGSIQVNEKGIKLGYIDSGPPDSASYRTLIAIHGYGYSADVFQKALPEARKKGFRMIALNRRDFPNSTPFTPEELSALDPSSLNITKYLTFIQQRSFEIIGFVHHAIQELGLPPPETGSEGNISVLGWSLGAFFAVAVMGCFDDPELPAAFRETVKEYISSVILYDPGIEAVAGRSSPSHSSWFEKIFMDNFDPANPTDFSKGMQAVAANLFGYFKYTFPSSPLSPDSEEAVKLRESYIASNDNPIRSTLTSVPDVPELFKSNLPGTIPNENLIAAGVNFGDYFKEIALYVLDGDISGVTRPQTEGKLPFSVCDPEGLMATKPLNWLWCENSTWSCAYPAQIYRERFGFDGKKKRKMASVPDANHFIQWEDPEKFVTHLLPML